MVLTRLVLYVIGVWHPFGMHMLSSESTLKAPIFAVLLMLLTSMSPLALEGTSESFVVHEEPTIIVPGLPSLICENGESCPTPHRGVGT